MNRLIGYSASFILSVIVSLTVQAKPLEEVIEDFCMEISLDANDADDELDEASRDLLDCSDEFNDCLTGFVQDDIVSCTSDTLQCVERARKDALQACAVFAKNLEDAYEDALREARRDENTEPSFLLWIETGGDSEACLAPAVEIANRCAGVLD